MNSVSYKCHHLPMYKTMVFLITKTNSLNLLVQHEKY